MERPCSVDGRQSIPRLRRRPRRQRRSGNHYLQLLSFGQVRWGNAQVIYLQGWFRDHGVQTRWWRRRQQRAHWSLGFRPRAIKALQLLLPHALWLVCSDHIKRTWYGSGGRPEPVDSISRCRTQGHDPLQSWRRQRNGECWKRHRPPGGWTKRTVHGQPCQLWKEVVLRRQWW